MQMAISPARQLKDSLLVIFDWLQRTCPDPAPSAMFIQSEGSDRGDTKYSCHKARDKTESKSNLRNVHVVGELLVHNIDLKGIKAADIKVITPYADQVRCYEQHFKDLASKFEATVRREDLPEVLTVDRMRGKEASVIIYDLTVTCGDKSHGIGIVADELRAHIASTRAKDMFVIVGSWAILGIFPRFWQGLSTRMKKDGRPLPYIVEYARQLKMANLLFDAPTSRLGYTIYNPPKKLWNDRRDKHDRDFEGGWEKHAHNSAGFDQGYA